MFAHLYTNEPLEIKGNIGFFFLWNKPSPAAPSLPLEKVLGILYLLIYWESLVMSHTPTYPSSLD